MRVIFNDDIVLKTICVSEVLDAYYDFDLCGLVFTLADPESDDIVFIDIEPTLGNAIILELFTEGCTDLRMFGNYMLYSDLVDFESEV